MTKLAGAHAVITGGSEGIGLATARACLRRGTRVSVIARGPDKLAAVGRAEPDIATASGDVTDPDALQPAIAAVTEVHGACDVIIACAGGARPGYVEQLDADTFREQVELNYLGVVHTVQAVLPSMLERGRGHLVLVSSVAGLFGVFGYGAYAPAKYAVRGFGHTLDAELRHRGITVSIVYPPDTRTPGFEQENRTKPPETVRVSGAIEPVAPEQVAAAIVRGIERDRLTITADRQSAVLARLADLHGPIVRATMRRMLRR
ncbi:MAG: SDR family oxidoreductase [Nitriliruptor sp.]|uniref:SDR family oxidoreductase n=1 Tax=Nitriliruptor sp. TaxID=2448056 RepID=UPI00349FEA64